MSLVIITDGMPPQSTVPALSSLVHSKFGVVGNIWDIKPMSNIQTGVTLVDYPAKPFYLDFYLATYKEKKTEQGNLLVSPSPINYVKFGTL